jgi:hypothetical protein
MVSHAYPFWNVVRDAVLGGTIALLLFAGALFMDGMRQAPERLRDMAANGDMRLFAHSRAVDILHRYAILVQGGLDGLIATRTRGDAVGEKIALERLRDNFVVFGDIATAGTIRQGSWQRRRIARRFYRDFADSYATKPDDALTAIRRFTSSYGKGHNT